jgi:hypothetical protein
MGKASHGGHGGHGGGLGVGGQSSFGDSGAPGRELSATGEASHGGHGGHRGDWGWLKPGFTRGESYLGPSGRMTGAKHLRTLVS